MGQSPNFSAALIDGLTSRTVAVRVIDSRGAVSATDTATITITNVDPTITEVVNSGPVDETSSVTVTVSATDPAGANDPLSYEFDFDNNGIYEVGPQSGNSATHTFADNGSYVVNVRVTDGDGGVATSSTTIAVNNVDPTITEVVNSGPVDEASFVTVTVSATDPAGETTR